MHRVSTSGKHLGELRADLYLSITLDTRVQSHAFPWHFTIPPWGTAFVATTALHMAEAPDVPTLDDLVAGIDALEDLEPSVQALEDLEPGVEALEDLEATLAVSSGHDVVLDVV